ncbi:MAG: FAD-dependent thymidylate synthase [Candidatus Thermoplasmatota archaeon]|nr:FAD-dependent thymidylate synthase [Candidatus Thermoplasmatota archaeon]
MSENNKSNFFSNTDRNVFILSSGSQIDRGALLSRYSRAANLDIRDLFEKEFLSNPERGREFYEKIFLEYGDESVAELVNVQMGMQNISNVAAKIIETGRIGLSFLEKSSRYVRYDRKYDGRYLYLDFEKTGLSGKFKEKYVEIMDQMFDFYTSALPKINDLLMEKFPLSMFGNENDASAEKAYKSAIRARSLDDIRAILPLSTVTNLGVSGNARSYISLIQRLSSSGLMEAKELSNMIYNELDSDYGQIIRSARNRHGGKYVEYLEGRNSAFPYLERNQGPQSMITSYNKWNLDHISELMGINSMDRDEFLLKAASIRTNRRDKLPRVFEFVDITFSLKMNYGIFREFQRHRFMSIVRGNLMPDLGYDIPELVGLDPEIKKQFVGIVESSIQFYEELIKDSNDSVAAQYVLPMCINHQMIVHTNLRELCYFAELRTTPHAHDDIRNLALSMVRNFISLEPACEPIFKFIDRGSYPLGRFYQEYRKEKKLDNISSH